MSLRASVYQSCDYSNIAAGAGDGQYTATAPVMHVDRNQTTANTLGLF